MAAQPIQFIAVDKSRTPMPAYPLDSVRSLEAFFLGRRLKNYLIIVAEKHVINLETAMMENPELCLLPRLSAYASKFLYKV